MSLPAVAVSQSPEDKFREYLASRSRPQRFTEPQRKMVDYIFRQEEHFDANQLIDDMKAAGVKVSRPTIYRTLTKLVDAGLLRRVEVGQHTFYERDYGRPQHEHMRCDQCGAMIEFQDATIEAVLREVCRRHNFQASGHTFVIRGTCATCNRARKTRRLLDLV